MIQSLDNVFFYIYKKGVKGFKLWDLKENKIVISKDAIFYEKALLQQTQEEKKQVPENCDTNKHEVQMELETHDREFSAQNAGSSSLEDQKHDSITTNKPRRIIRPPTRYGFEDLVSYALITSSGDPTMFQEA